MDRVYLCWVFFFDLLVLCCGCCEFVIKILMFKWILMFLWRRVFVVVLVLVDFIYEFEVVVLEVFLDNSN